MCSEIYHVINCRKAFGIFSSATGIRHRADSRLSFLVEGNGRVEGRKEGLCPPLETILRAPMISVHELRVLLDTDASDNYEGDHPCIYVNCLSCFTK
jgi:hypothetical protein